MNFPQAVKQKFIETTASMPSSKFSNGESDTDFSSEDTHFLKRVFKKAPQAVNRWDDTIILGHHPPNLKPNEPAIRLGM